MGCCDDRVEGPGVVIRAHVQVHGLTELRRALKQIEDPTRRKEVLAGFKAAAKIVADEARGNVPQKSGRAAKSIRTGAAWQKGSAQAFVVGGKKAVPYYGWLDFGSRTPKVGNPRSVGPWRGSGTGPKEGRFIYPAIKAKGEQVAMAIRQGVDAVIRGAGF